jgi:hypothetical protein
MSKIAEIISVEGEVFSVTDFGSQNEFDFKILNSLDFEIIKAFFIKKTIIDTIRHKHKISNGSNGVTTVELINLFKWNDIEVYIDELVAKKFIVKKQGISLEMYFLTKK